MMVAKKAFLLSLLIVFLGSFSINAQPSSEMAVPQDTISSSVAFLNDFPQTSAKYHSQNNPYKFQATQLIPSVALIGLGVVGLIWPGLRGHYEGAFSSDQNGPIYRTYIDNYLQFVPPVTGYAMNLFGFKGKHNVADATILYGTAYVLLGASLLTLKGSIHSHRPNSFNSNSFPSGHTAIAFCGAELLRREYWQVSPVIGMAGYMVAAATGLLRIYNHAHWVNDVLAGAGLGILCAQAAYWLYPALTKTFFKKRYDANIFLAPSASTSGVGLACAITF